MIGGRYGVYYRQGLSSSAPENHNVEAGADWIAVFIVFGLGFIVAGCSGKS